MKTVEESKFRSHHGVARDDETISSLRSPFAASTPVFASSQPILSMQQSLGNQAVQRIVSPTILQPKLTVGAPDDEYEKEADTVAEQVMSFRQPQAAAAPGSEDEHGPHSTLTRKPSRLGCQSMLSRVPIQTLQKTLGNRALARLLTEKGATPAVPQMRRKCACGGDAEGECDECRMSRMALQRNSTRADVDWEAPPIVDDVLATPGEPLAASARKALEPGFGHDFSQVRVHDDSRAAESASAVNAVAYTVGNHIVFGAGQYAPGTNDGHRLLAHELTHTVQQTGGSPQSIQRLSWDDVTDAASEVGSAVSSGAQAVGSAISSGAEAVGSAVSSGAEAVGSTISSGAESASEAISSGASAVGQVVSSGAQTIAEGAQAVGNAIVSGGASASQADIAGIGSSGTPGGPDPCLDLLQQIIDLLNIVADRIRQALDDEYHLYDFRPGPNPDHPEAGTWDGHRDRFKYDRDRLRQKIAEWDSNDDCRNFRLNPQQQEDLKEANEFKEKEFPDKPAPSMRDVEPEPSLREKIAEALRKAGIPAWAVAGMIVLIIAALADPEPFTKVVLLVGAAVAIVIFIAIGRHDDIPPTAVASTGTGDQGGTVTT